MVSSEQKPKQRCFPQLSKNMFSPKLGLGEMQKTTLRGGFLLFFFLSIFGIILMRNIYTLLVDTKYLFIFIRLINLMGFTIFYGK
jgi:hypothetical protein